MENQEVKEGLEDFSAEAEVCLIKVRDTMNSIGKLFNDSGIDETSGHVALALLLRKSRQPELYAFMAAQMEGQFHAPCGTVGAPVVGETVKE